MSVPTLKIFEFSKKSVTTCASEPGFRLTPGEVEKLEKFNEVIKKRNNLASNVLSFNYRAEKVCEVCSYSHVGVIKIGAKTIQIMPKIARGGLSEDEHNKDAINNLLYMLSYTKRLKVSETNISSLTRTSDNFFEILIHLFASNLLKIIQNDINKQYVSRSENLSFIKGKLQLNAHLKHNLVNRQMFYMEFDDFCEDNLLNQVLKCTVSLLLRSTTNFHNLKMLQQLDRIFDGVSRRIIMADDFRKIVLNRLNFQYEPIVSLAKIFLTNSSLKLSANNLETFSFVIDMNVLFEEFIGEFVKKELGESYDRVSLQKPVRRLVEEKIKRGISTKEIFEMKPDIQIFNEGKTNPSIIIDTKYKLLDERDERREGVSQADLYQMFAYSKKFGCEDIILLYPKSVDQQATDVVFKIDNKTRVFLRMIDLCRDIRKHKQQFRRELAMALDIV